MEKRSTNTESANTMTPNEMNLLRERVLLLCVQYLDVLLGIPEAAPNSQLHDKIADLGPNKYWDDVEVMTEILEELEYRLDMIRLADRYVEFLGLSGLTEGQCAAWDGMPRRPDRDEERWQLVAGCVRMQQWRLFPPPANFEERRWWYKRGFFFLIATLYISAWDIELIEKKVAELVKIKEDTWTTPEKSNDADQERI